MAELDVVRVPGARPMFKTRHRERQWDERFVLERIPAYDAFKDKHCLAYLIANRRKKTVLAPGRIRKAKSPSNSVIPQGVRGQSNIRSNKPVLVGEVLRQLRSNLLEMWTIQRIPQELWQPIIDAMDSGTVRERAEAFAHEIEDTEAKKSILQSLTKAIASREAAISSLPTSLDQDTVTPRYIKHTRDTLASIRMLTLHVVECAAAYKGYIARLKGGEMETVPVLHQGVNYLGKVKSDLRFLAATALANIFELSEKNDPFLLIPAHPKQRNKEEIPIPAVIFERIKVAEKVLLDEPSLYLPPDQAPPLPKSPSPQKPPFSYKVQITQEEASEEIKVPGQKPLSEAGESEKDAGLPPMANTDRKDLPSFRFDDKTEGVTGRSEVSREDEAAIQTGRGQGGAAVTPKDATARSFAVPVETENSAKVNLADLEVSGFDLETTRLRTELEEFLVDVPVHIRESFWDKSSFDSLLQQAYPCWLQITHSSHRFGIFCFSIDTLNTSTKRVIINHISARSDLDLSLTLDKALRYIWKTIGCSEVRIAVNYREIDGEMKADPVVKSMVTDRKFRWKNLINTGDRRRIIILAVPRPESVPEDHLPSDFFKESLLIKYACGVQIAPIDQIPSTPDPNNLEVVSILGLTATMKSYQDLSPPENSLQSHLHILRQKITEEFAYPACKVTENDDLTTALEKAGSQELKLTGLAEGLVTNTAWINVGLRWEAFDTCLLELHGQSHHYLRISNLEVNVLRSAEEDIYLLPTDYSKFNLLIIMPSGELPKEPWTKAVSTLQELTNGTRSFTQTTREIWLPGFAIQQVSSAVEGLVGVKVEGERGVTSACETFSMVLQAPIHSQGNLTFTPSPDSVVVSKSFLMGNLHLVILNSQLDDLTPLPYLVASVPASSFTIHATS